MTETKTPEEALTDIKEAASEGHIAFADDTLAASLNAEVQRIFVSIHTILKGCPPKRCLWASDGTTIGFTLPWDGEGQVTPEAHAAVAKAADQLGIDMKANDLFIDAALRLRSKEQSGQGD
jgi:hypothetical protein